MTAALPTRAEVETALLRARAEVIECEDCGDRVGAELARCRCDTLLDLLWTHMALREGR
jgi:hypothetical protein